MPAMELERRNESCTEQEQELKINSERTNRKIYYVNIIISKREFKVYLMKI